jgi:hypothetical protein
MFQAPHHFHSVKEFFALSAEGESYCSLSQWDGCVIISVLDPVFRTQPITSLLPDSGKQDPIEIE